MMEAVLMVRDFKASSWQRFRSDVRFLLPEVAAGIALVLLLVLLPIISSVF